MLTLNQVGWMIAVTALACLPPSSRTAEPDHTSLLGKPAPAWEVSNWINGKPITLQELRSKVVLVEKRQAPAALR